MPNKIGSVQSVSKPQAFITTMPLIDNAGFRRPWFLPSGHLETIYPIYFRPKLPVPYQRERITTPDGDFLDLDWLRHASPAPRVAILIHGLEGSADRATVRGMSHYLHGQGYDTVGLNLRYCSGHINQRPPLYHHGFTLDLETAVQHVAATHPCQQLVLVGWSLGGSITLNYLADLREQALPSIVSAAVALSTPVDIPSCIAALSRGPSRIYQRWMFKKIEEKVQQKHKQFPELYPLIRFRTFRDFTDFDRNYTCPVFGFESPQAVYNYSNSRQRLHKITVPTLLLNAVNDPMLPPACFPEPEARQSKCFFLEAVPTGGHVGFMQAREPRHFTYAEQRVGGFFKQQLGAVPVMAPPKRKAPA